LIAWLPKPAERARRGKGSRRRVSANVDHSVPFSGIQELPKNFLFSAATAARNQKIQVREIV